MRWYVLVGLLAWSLMVFVGYSYGAAELDQISGEVKLLQSDQTVLKSMQADLDKEKEQLLQITNTWNDAVKTHKEQWNILDANIAEWRSESHERERQTNVHNANPPDSRNEAAVNAYNAEADRLKSWRYRLVSKHQELQRKESDLKWSGEQLEKARLKNNDMVMQWTAKQKALNAKWDDWRAKMDSLKKKAIGNCMQLLKDPKTTDEALKWGCGTFFDGSNPGLPTLEQMGIKPSFKATPN